MKSLVTGCAGFIGSKVVELLLKAGKQVLGIDDINDYYAPALKLFRLEQLKKLGGDFTFLQADIEKKDTIIDLFKGNNFEVVYNLAARAGVRASIVDPVKYFTTNTLGTLNLLECMRVFGVKKFIFASTSSLYAGHSLPFSETLAVNEPISPYAASKKSAEVLCYTYHHLYELDVSIVRCFTVYGPYGRPDMSPDIFMKNIYCGEKLQLYGDGKQSRDFTYVDDIAEGIILASKALGYEIINLGGEKPYTINEMIGFLEHFLGKKADISYLQFNKSDMKDTWADISKAKKLLDWYPRVSLRDGISKMVSAFLAMQKAKYIK